jgi:hypothetical protein
MLGPAVRSMAVLRFVSGHQKVRVGTLYPDSIGICTKSVFAKTTFAFIL